MIEVDKMIQPKLCASMVKHDFNKLRFLGKKWQHLTIEGCFQTTNDTIKSGAIVHLHIR